jgi:hypothetical protein
MIVASFRAFPRCFFLEQGELRRYTIGEHAVNTQGFPPYKVSLSILSFWEDAEVKKQIDFGKMRSITHSMFVESHFSSRRMRIDGSMVTIDLSTCKHVRTLSLCFLLIMSLLN